MSRRAIVADMVVWQEMLENKELSYLIGQKVCLYTRRETKAEDVVDMFGQLLW